MKKCLIATIYFFLACLNLYGQVTSNLSVMKDSVSLGEAVHITYELKWPASARLVSLDFSAWDSIVSMEFKMDSSAAKQETDLEWHDQAFSSDKQLSRNSMVVSDENAYRIFSDTFSVRIWDPGYYVFEHPKINLVARDSSLNVIRFQPPLVKVYPPLDITPPDTNEVIFPVRDILAVDLPFWYRNRWLLVFAGIIFLIFLIMMLRRIKRQSVVGTPETRTPTIPAHIIAHSKLDRLAEERLWEKGQVKEHQSRLSHIIREYIENRYDIPALESTTSEIMKYLQHELPEAQLRREMIALLQVADMVKFAKAQPAQDLNEIYINKAREFVDQTAQLPLDDQTIEDHE